MPKVRKIMIKNPTVLEELKDVTFVEVWRIVKGMSKGRWQRERWR